MATGDRNAPEDHEKTREDRAREDRARSRDQRSDRESRLGPGFAGSLFKRGDDDETVQSPQEAARQAQLALLALIAGQGRRATILTGPQGDRSGDLIRPTILRGM